MSISKNKLSAAQAISEITGHLYFGDMVKSLRMCDNIPQAEMARSIGISRQYLCNIESGERKADVELALKFAEYLDIASKRLVRFFGNYPHIQI